ncbi:NAD(P)-binding protein [Annulohypoxylon maeteangense]|uniref:NAD(P)-binding protein n=1 Tax=Annulohypoxylon maeteangense TaxID=1927788 RepID=UPI002007E17E|nr:NAD(P)-binding protein [Annulohypoxylon maeteangense]KAI0883034.1 NAD(P)-binding protein [Annulohypoxylon maeteangense]
MGLGLTGRGSRLIIVKIDSTSDADARDAVAYLGSSENISHLDIVVANAGLSIAIGPLIKVKPGQLAELIDVNSLGPLRLAQATLPLLANAPARPRFVLLGSMQGSTGGMEKYPLPMGAYGASKAAAHFLVRKLHFELAEEGICVFAVDPGFVQTDMGNAGAKIFGMDEAVTKVDDAIDFVKDQDARHMQIDSATREKTSGRFPSIGGGETEW